MANLKSVFLGSWLGDQLMRDSTVASVTEMGPRFRRAVIRGLTTKVEPGDKIQIYIPDAGTRTYSPFAYDAAAGTFELALFTHGDGPGAAWARALKAGDRVRFIGPQGSLALGSLAGPVALFGDETAFGVARSLFDLRRGDAQFRFEVGPDVEVAAAALGLPREALVPRGDLAAIARDLAAMNATLVLTGNAHSIQALRNALKDLGNDRPQRVKSYWAEGKRGLD
jgi:ferric-chelate reductase (NADPH)